MTINDIEIPSFIHLCLTDLEQRSKELTSTETRYAKQTIAALGILYSEKKDLCQLTNETERNLKITELTKLIAEPGLIPGNTPEEIENAILCRINLLRCAFLYDSAREETVLLYKQGFIGPPCFNGRVITLQHYVLKRQGIKTDFFYEFSTPFDDQAVQLEEIMYSCNQYFALKDDNPPSLAQLKEFAKLNPKVFSKGSLNMDSDNILDIYRRACEFFVG